MPLADGSPQTGFAIERDPRLRFIIPAIVAFAFLMEQLDSTGIVTAIPDIARSLGTTPLRMSIAVTTYVLALAMFIPVSGWFADRFGARRVFALALAVFTIGSVLCGLATSFPMLIATRALQGIGGAMMTPVGRLILIRSFPRSQLVTAMTYMTYPAIIGPVIGPLLGGFLTTYVSWRWIFFINVPFGLIGIVMTLRFVDEARSPGVMRFDFPGFLMVGVGLVLLQYGIETIGRPAIPIPATAAVILAACVLLIVFFFYARRVPAPAVDFSLFRIRSFWVGTLIGGLCRLGLNGFPYLLPLMLQVGFGFTPMESGMLTFASVIGAVAVRPVMSRLLRTFGFATALIASAIVGSALLASFAAIGPETPHWIITVLVILFGLARSTQFMTSNTLSYSDMPAELLSRATSLGGVLQQLSVSFGVAAAATLLGLVTLGGTPLTPARFHDVFLMMAVIPILSIPGFLWLRPEDGVQVSQHTGRRGRV